MSRVPGTFAAIVRRASLVLALGAGGLAVALLHWPGFFLHLGSATISVRRSLNPALIAIVSFAVFVVLNGVPETIEDTRRLGIALMRLPGRLATALARIDRPLAIVLAIGIIVVGVTYATTAASGSDAYGYVSQADLWLKGDLHIQQGWEKRLPWPQPAWTFTPLGYIPFGRDGRATSLVPLYSPGLPMMLAAAKLVGGQAAMFWVVPLSGALLVLATFGIGRRLGSSKAGLAAAWLVATSPAVLFMLMAPMTDVPVAAFWTWSFYAWLGRRGRDALIAGVAAGIAILIRPNLVFGAAFLGLWYLVEWWRGSRAERRERVRHALCFAIGPAAAAAIVATLNAHLYGSPFLSGYGSTASMFALENFSANARHYVGWLLGSETPVVLLGLAAIFVPLRRIWPGAPSRRVFVVIDLFVLAVWLLYCFYLQFDTWWFLRFLLSTWPFIMLGVAAVLVTLVRRRGPSLRLAMAAFVIGLGLYRIVIAGDGHAFGLWHEERRYVTAARLARDMTPESSVILAMQHSGSLRYYGGRMTMRYDNLDEEWVDRAVAWLTDRGVHVYLLAEDWEMPDIRRRFRGTEALARIDGAPMFVLKATTVIRMWDLSGPPRDPAITPARVIDDPDTGARNAPPAPPPTLVFSEPRAESSSN